MTAHHRRPLWKRPPDDRSRSTASPRSICAPADTREASTRSAALLRIAIVLLLWTRRKAMTSPSRTATCSCGQLSIEVQGEPLGTGICHCLFCQRRTGSVFATLACFAGPYTVVGRATQYVHVGDRGGRFTFRFCPVCGTTLFHTEEGREDGSVDVAVGTFADPSFPPPQGSVYDRRRHPWVHLPPGIKVYGEDPG